MNLSSVELYQAYCVEGVLCLDTIIGLDNTLRSISDGEHSCMVEQIVAQSWRIA